MAPTGRSTGLTTVSSSVTAASGRWQCPECVLTRQIHPVEKYASHATVGRLVLLCLYNCAGALVGNDTVKQLPFPGVDSTFNLPPSSEVTMR